MLLPKFILVFLIFVIKVADVVSLTHYMLYMHYVHAIYCSRSRKLRLHLWLHLWGHSITYTSLSILKDKKKKIVYFEKGLTDLC